MVRAGRSIYLVLAWLFLLGVVVQFFLAGTAVFAGQSFTLHRDFGLVLHASTLALIVVAILVRMPARAVLLGVVLFILIGIQVALVRLRRPYAPLDLEPSQVTSLVNTVMKPIHDLFGGSAGWIASLHVINGLLIIGAGWGNVRVAQLSLRTDEAAESRGGAAAAPTRPAAE